MIDFFSKLIVWALGGKKPSKEDILEEKAAEYFLAAEPDKALAYIQNLNSEATAMHNEATSQRRNIFTTISITSGTFLTVALPILVSIGSSITHVIIFDLLLGISISLSEWRVEIDRAAEMIHNGNEAILLLHAKKIKESAGKLMLCVEDFRKGKKFWRYLWIINLRNAAIDLFYIGIIGFVALMLMR